jgi:hypothetical protein
MSATSVVNSDSAPADLHTPFGPLPESYSGVGYRPERRSVMDTMTYASVAVLPWSIAEERTHFVRQDLELPPLDLSMIKR